MATSLPLPKTCRDRCSDVRKSREDELPDIHDLGPVGIVRAEMLAAVDELLETFRARG